MLFTGELDTEIYDFTFKLVKDRCTACTFIDPGEIVYKMGLDSIADETKLIFIYVTRAIFQACPIVKYENSDETIKYLDDKLEQLKPDIDRLTNPRPEFLSTIEKFVIKLFGH